MSSVCTVSQMKILNPSGAQVPQILLHLRMGGARLLCLYADLEEYVPSADHLQTMVSSVAFSWLVSLLGTYRWSLNLHRVSVQVQPLLRPLWQR